MIKDIEKLVHVEVVHAETEGRAKCLRCRKYEHECGFDKRNGCENLLCNRCEAEVKEHYPDDASVKDFVAERIKIYGAKAATDG